MVCFRVRRILLSLCRAALCIGSFPTVVHPANGHVRTRIAAVGIQSSTEYGLLLDFAVSNWDRSDPIRLLTRKPEDIHAIKPAGFTTKIRKRMQDRIAKPRTPRRRGRTRAAGVLGNHIKGGSCAFYVPEYATRVSHRSSASSG